MEKHLYVVEDSLPFREKAVDRFRKLGVFGSVIPCKNKHEFQNKFKVNGFAIVGLFDIVLEHMITDNTDGLDCARMMREKSPSAYIAAYSGAQELASQAEKAGANQFFLRNAYQEESFFKTLQDQFLDHYGRIEKGLSDFRLKYEIKSIVDCIDEKGAYVTLSCLLGEDKFFTKRIPINKFSHLDVEDLRVDKSLIIRILENKEGETMQKIQISPVSFSQLFDDAPFPEIHVKTDGELLGSPIFSQKNRRQ